MQSYLEQIPCLKLLESTAISLKRQLPLLLALLISLPTEAGARDSIHAAGKTQVITRADARVKKCTNQAHCRLQSSNLAELATQRQALILETLLPSEQDFCHQHDGQDSFKTTLPSSTLLSSSASPLQKTCYKAMTHSIPETLQHARILPTHHWHLCRCQARSRGNTHLHCKAHQGARKDPSTRGKRAPHSKALDPTTLPPGPIWAQLQLVNIHRHILTHCDGPRSHFYPVSSNYMLDAIKEWGAWRGMVLGLERLLRENNEPWLYATLERESRQLKYDPLLRRDDLPRKHERSELKSSTPESIAHYLTESFEKGVL